MRKKSPASGRKEASRQQQSSAPPAPQATAPRNTTTAAASKGKAKPEKPLAPLPMIPFVGKIDISDVELCDDPSAGPMRHMEDSEKLLAAFETGVHAHEALIAKAVSKVEQRCTAQRNLEKREGIEAATLAAIQTTELRMKAEQREAIAEAVAAERAAGQKAQDVAVAEAVKLAEERCAEQQRLMMANVGAAHRRELGVPEEEVAANTAAFNFQEASNAAAAAMAAAARACSRARRRRRRRRRGWRRRAVKTRRQRRRRGRRRRRWSTSEVDR